MTNLNNNRRGGRLLARLGIAEAVDPDARALVMHRPGIAAALGNGVSRQSGRGMRRVTLADEEGISALEEIVSHGITYTPYCPDLPVS